MKTPTEHTILMDIFASLEVIASDIDDGEIEDVKELRRDLLDLRGMLQKRIENLSAAALTISALEGNTEAILETRGKLEDYVVAADGCLARLDISCKVCGEKVRPGLVDARGACEDCSTPIRGEVSR